MLKRNVAYSVVAQFLRYGAPLAYFPILTRSLGSRDFATFALAYAVALVAGQVIEFGFGLMGVRALAEAKSDPVGARLAASEVIIGKVFVTVAVLLVLWLLYTFFSENLEVDYSIFFPTCLLSVALGFVPSWYYIGTGKSSVYALMEAFAALFQFLLVFIVLRSAASIQLALYMIATPWLLTCLWGNFSAVKDLGICKLGKGQIFHCLKVSFNFFCITNVPMILARSYIFFIGWYSTSADVAFYAVGERILYAAINGVTPITRVILPVAISRYSSDNMDGYRYAKKIWRNVGAIFALGAVCGAFISPWFVPVVFGSDLTRGVPVVALLMLCVPGMVMTRLIGMLAFIPMHREERYQRVTLIVSALGVVTSLFMAMVYGGIGVAMSRLLLETGLALALWYMQLKLFSDSKDGAS